MIVLDASAVVELMLRSASGRALASRLEEDASSLHAPHLLDIEVMHVFRRYVIGGHLSAARAGAAIELMLMLDIERHPHELLLPRIWDLRANLSAYDATYVALSEVLDATLFTGDQRLARAPGTQIAIELVRDLPTP